VRLSKDFLDKQYSHILLESNAGIAQLVECQLPKLNVAGSNPVARSEAIFKKAL
jgi:hypothetical protein